ncbi:hypothetical protein ETJ89_19650 [Bacillus albus]|nr:hypothetical protein ETJ89_19650 [Bacillus albus]
MDFRKGLQSKSYAENVDTVKGLESKYEISPHKTRAYFLSCYLPGSKTPTSKFSGSKEVRWGAGCP